MEVEAQKLEQFKGQNRLPKFAIPKRYDLTLKPDLSACTYSGLVQIELSVVHVTQFLVLNALELDIHEVSVSDYRNQKYIPSDIVVDSDDEILVLAFDEALSVGNGVLEISFSGVLNEHLKGFYRCTYVDGGEKKNMVVTQFEAATFKITVENVPSELTALSNMPVSQEKHYGHLKTTCFEESQTMSTYLVAVVVGLFDHIEDTTVDGTKVRVYSPVGKSEKGKFALNIAVKALEFFKKYFSMSYTLPKLDMVAVPEFSGGAMENYDLITYREMELLRDDLHSTVANTQRLVIVVTHEVAHQWFGNLVTMEWWTHLWLNEGFATWVSYLVTDILFPEWKIWSQFLQVTADGLRIDALEQSHPIEVEVHHGCSVLEVFDVISYKKGSAVIRMFRDYLGDEIFQKSLASYMKSYACKNAKTEDLWNVISEISGVKVNKMMDIWTKQKGYPLISVKSRDGFLEFEQSQFLSSGLHGEGQWTVPLTLSLGSYNKCKKFLLETKAGKLGISELYLYSDGNSSPYENKNQEKLPGNLWVKINIGQTGLVKYDDDLTAQLRKSIDESYLSAEDKFGLDHFLVVFR
ncbi:unnamed protein product [Ilex paraguariensis]|uniref:Alpha-aminoacylpeptide hydrolase n=1 Tax=Ilex paraguariensis TaxID=185542 RepID=A0ABC8UFY6_9AQUA